MNRSGITATLGLLVLFLLMGCGEGDAPTSPGAGEKAPAARTEPAPETPAATAPEPPPEPTAAAAPRQVTASVGSLFLSPETPTGAVDVRFTLPAGWAEAPAYGENRWGPEGVDLAFGFDAACNGNCHPAAIAGNLAKGFDGFKDSAARPNLNTGDPARDALRASVETLAEAELPSGRLLALRVTYSKEIMASGPYRPQLRMRCAWHTPGDSWYLTLDLRADLEPGEAALPALLDICRSVEALGPTRSAAEQQEPLVLDTPRCVLPEMPETAYTVESRNSEEKPSVILLTRPVVIGGLPLAPIGRVYVEYNDDPISLRDVFTAADRSFQIGGVEVTCLRRQPLRIDGACGLRRCILAREAGFGAFSLPAYSEITLETDAPDRVKRVEVPAGATLTVGPQEYTGPGRAVFNAGTFETWKPHG